MGFSIESLLLSFIPLIIGPAALTTILILVDTHGYVTTIVSLE
ncbi:MAG: hypothetical protein V1799_06070 [bacterium]